MIDKRIAKIITDLQERCFAEHWGELHHIHQRDGGLMQRLYWRKKDDSSNYAMTYLCTGKQLIVLGDLGEAIYGSWNQSVTLDWIANLNLDYFHGKCQASEFGTHFLSWDPQIAWKSVNDNLRASAPSRNEFRKKLKQLRALNDGLHPKNNCLATKSDWHQWLSVHGQEVFQDYWSLGGVGEVIHWRCVAHLIGLKMAMGVSAPIRFSEKESVSV